MNSRSVKARKVLERLQSLEGCLQRANEYLETGEHADWHRFRPLFVANYDGDREKPPHKDWVRNVFIPRCEQRLHKAEKTL